MPLLKYLYPDFLELPSEKQDDLLEKMALKYQDLITEYYDTLASKAFNINKHRLEMKTECTIRSGFFSRFAASSQRSFNKLYAIEISCPNKPCPPKCHRSP